MPTFQEQGIDVSFSSWYGIAAHKGMPPEIKAKLLEALNNIVNDPEYVQNMEMLGMQVEYLGHKEFQEKWLAESEQLRIIIKEAGIAEKIAYQKN